MKRQKRPTVNTPEKKNGCRDVLLATVGTSPAVIAETVWALSHPSREGAERVVPDEVVALTTLKGKERIERDLPLPAAPGSASSLRSARMVCP